MVAHLSWMWRRVPRPVRVLFASSAATLADTAVLLALCRFVGLGAGAAAAIGSIVGGALNFTINRVLVFGARNAPWSRQAVHYAVIVVGGGAAVSGAAVAALVAMGLPILAAKAVAVIVVLATWTYPMSARVVFAPRTARGPGPSVADTADEIQTPSASSGTPHAARSSNAPPHRRSPAITAGA
jgi:putative flippase GtrA